MDSFTEGYFSEYFKSTIAKYRLQWHVESERHNKFAILVKMALFCLLEYQMVRFVNTTNRHCFVSVKDCLDCDHILYTLKPGQSVLVLNPKSKHTFKASDTCTRQELIMDFGTKIIFHEYICLIKAQMEPLKDLSLKCLSHIYRHCPHEIEKLKVPTQIKKEIYYVTIPCPNGGLTHIYCHECCKKIPKILDCNPVSLSLASAPEGSWKVEAMITNLRKFLTTLDEYLTTSDFLHITLGDLLSSNNS